MDMKIGVCLEMVHTDLPYDQRIMKIAEAGFDTVEFWMHNGKDPVVLRQVSEENGVRLSDCLVNTPDGGVGGAPVDPRDHGKYIEKLHEVIEFGKAAGVSAGITCTGNLVPGLSREEMKANCIEVYSEAAAVAEANGFTLLLETLNTLVNHKGYYLDSTAEAAEIVRAVGSPAFKMLYDVYHMQIMEGNVIANIEANIDIIGHFHSAGVPGRHEIMSGELDYRNILARIEAAGYTGVFGLEYSPSYDSDGSLRATAEYLRDYLV